jgi:glycosyltransferase involved in cell wall biosynthesis
MRRLTRAALALSRPAYVAVSQAVKDYSCVNLAIRPEQVRVIYNGVDLTEFSPDGHNGRSPHNGRTVIGMAARFSAEKNHDGLLTAAAELARRGVDFELRLAGEGGLRPQCKKRAAALGIAERVRFLGMVEDVPRFLDDLDVFVLPSLREGLPMTILEAMAMGVPVVATGIAGVPEVVRHGENGLLVPPGDPTALADALACLAGDEPLRRRLGRNALVTVREGFSVALTARRLERFYAKVLGEGNPR